MLNGWILKPIGNLLFRQWDYSGRGAFFLIDEASHELFSWEAHSTIIRRPFFFPLLLGIYHKRCLGGIHLFVQGKHRTMLHAEGVRRIINPNPNQTNDPASPRAAPTLRITHASSTAKAH